jgi:glycosyltransferase involved in cell wall biosynthesis
MKILLINHYAGNTELGMEFRPYYLAKQWVKQGHEVAIVAASYSHLRKQQPEVRRNIEIAHLDGIKYIWIKTPAYKSSGISRFINILTFVIKLFVFQRRLTKELYPDAVIASSTYPIDIYPARSIAKKCNAKLCFELHDLWPLSPMVIGGYSKWHPFIMLMQAGENYACKKSDVVASLLGNAMEHLVEHGMSPEKFHRVKNGFDMDEYNNDKEDIPSDYRILLSSLKRENKFIAGYSGGINPSNAMMTWIAAAKLLSKNNTVAFVSVGSGTEAERLKEFKRKNGLNNVFILEPVAKTAIPALLSRFDLLFIAGVKSSLHKHGIAPNKLTDYMLAGKPIILSADVENEIVDRVGCGVTVPAEDGEAVKNAILKLAAMDENERKSMGEKGREYALRELNYENLSKKFISILSNENNP